MPEPKCANCSFRAKYDRNPKSLLGRLWRWHINWCPGWKGYMKSLPEDQKTGLRQKYQLKP
jgi:hypothetical protein